MLTTIIQEIVNKSGADAWVSGNDIVIMIEDNGSSFDAFRDFISADGDVTVVTLVIWYGGAGGGGGASGTFVKVRK